MKTFVVPVLYLNVKPHFARVDLGSEFSDESCVFQLIFIVQDQVKKVANCYFCVRPLSSNVLMAAYFDICFKIIKDLKCAAKSVTINERIRKGEKT